MISLRRHQPALPLLTRPRIAPRSRPRPRGARVCVRCARGARGRIARRSRRSSPPSFSQTFKASEKKATDFKRKQIEYRKKFDESFAKVSDAVDDQARQAGLKEVTKLVRLNKGLPEGLPLNSLITLVRRTKVFGRGGASASGTRVDAHPPPPPCTYPAGRLLVGWLARRRSARSARASPRARACANERAERVLASAG